MASWKRILTSDDVVTENLGNTNLTQSQTTRSYTIDGNGSQLNFVSEHGGTILQIFSGVMDASTDGCIFKGQVSFKGSTDASTSAVKFFEAADNGTHAVTIQASNFTETYTLKLPTADGSNGQVLQTDGSGNLSFADAGGGTIDGSGASNKIAIWSDSDTLTSDTNLSWVSASDTLVGVNVNASGSVDTNHLIANVIHIQKQPQTNAAGAYDGAGSRVFQKVGATTTPTNPAGKVFALVGSGTGSWTAADKDAESTSIGLLAVWPNSGGPASMIQEGVVMMQSNQGFSSSNAGTPLYLGDDGAVTASAPTGQGDIARIVGYVLNASARIIYFNPDSTYVKIA